MNSYKGESHTIIDSKIKILSVYSSLEVQCAARTIICWTMLSINKLNKLFKMYETLYIIIQRISKFSTYIINSILNVNLSFFVKVNKSCSLILSVHK